MNSKMLVNKFQSYVLCKKEGNLDKMTVVRVYAGKSFEINSDQDENKNLIAINLESQFTELIVTHLTQGIACNTPLDANPSATDKALKDLV